jgi:arylsulfatase A-like enzyme
MADRPRGVLPIPERRHVGATTYDAKDPEASFPPIVPLRPPAGAPVRAAHPAGRRGIRRVESVRGSVSTPTAEQLAAGGLRFTRFHTTALWLPTRAALLTGRDHHSVNMAEITEIATSAPGYSSGRPADCAPLPETLRLNGYSTAPFCKCHEVPVWETSPLGPFDRRTGRGFEHFCGFIGGETTSD